MRIGKALATVAASVLAAGLVAVPGPAVARQPAAPLTNLAHLDFLTSPVTPPDQNRHTTYRLDAHPSVGVLWVYATHNDDGSFTRVGGGDYDSATDTYGQGAFDADDIARAAVVYLRHWQQFDDAQSKAKARALLRGLTYLQTDSGPNRGNVVLWMQPDGTINPSADPKDDPDPSDSANSYWLARTIWALGEGYADFAGHDSAFAHFLRTRMRLAIGALRRDSLSRFGQYLHADGARTPAWLIAGGADASAEAVLGLSAYVRAGGPGARTALDELATGIADLGTPAGRSWPGGAILPSATSRSSWHAWASLTPAALAEASTALRDPSLARPAARDARQFSPALLTEYGPINGLTPAPTDGSQIAYGVDSRVESLLAVARVEDSTKLRRLAGVFAGWYFGQNPAGVATYDPATGVTDDGVAADGTLNRNSGAESTIHGLLSMLALDAHPAVARIAEQSAAVTARRGATVVEGEAATVTGSAQVADADPASSAESAWSGGKYLAISGSSTASWTVPADPRPRIVTAVVDRLPGRAAKARFDGVGAIDFGGGAPQGASAVPGRLVPVRVGTLAAGATAISARFTGSRGKLDALLLTPRVSVLRTPGSAVLSNLTERRRTTSVPGYGAVTVAPFGFRVLERRP
ncbi:MAG TPA: hypothetical protein VGH30_04120 [Jatrophihabitantaceae bacterium]